GGVTLHVIRLEHRTPSFVVGILSQFDRSGTPTTSSGSTKKRGKSKKRKSSRSRTGQGSTGKFTADDAEKRLFVLCTEEEWESYLPIIAQLEAEVEPTGPTFTLIAVEHITPEEAVGKLKILFVAIGEKKRGTGINSVRFEPADGAVMVVNATLDEIQQMRELLVVFDRPVEIVRQVFDIRFVGPDDIISAIEALIIHTKSSSTVSRRGGTPAGKAKTTKAAGTPEVTLLAMGNRLFVRATREKMDAIVELIEEFDVELERTTLRVYEDFSAGTDIEQIAETLTVLMVGAKAAPKKRPRGEAQQQRAKFQAIPQPEAGRLIVVAQPAQFEEIEELLEILRVDIGPLAIETVFVDVQFAEPQEIVEFVDPFLQMKIQELLSSGKLKSLARPPITLGKGTKPGGKRGIGAGGRAAGAMASSWYHLEADARNSRVVIAAPQIVVDEAKRLIAQFDVSPEIDVPTVETALVDVRYGDPEDIIDLVQPLLSLKVRELVERGELKGAVELPAGPPRGKKAGQKKPPTGGRSAGRTDEWFHLAADTLNHRIVIAAPQVVVDIAKELIALFDFRPDSDVESIETALVDVQFADPEDIIDLVRPLLSMKVQELVERGVLKGAAAVSSKSKQPKKGRGKASAGARTAGRSDGWFHLASDSWNRRVVIAAPQVVIDIATELVAKFDARSSQNEPIVKTIELQNSTATDMVKAIREMMGKPSRATGAKGKPRGKPSGGLVTPEFSIIAAPGDRAVMLRAVAELVEQATDWIMQLDSLPGGARKIKVYELHHADPAQLVDLIMATVGAPVSTSGKKGGRARARAAALEEEDDDPWVTKIKRSAPDLYIEADLIANTMIVAAPPAKLAEVDAIVAQFDTVEEGARRAPGVPKFVYTLEHRDPLDAEFEAQSVFEALWEPNDEIPRVESAMWGDYLVVEYPHEDRFGEIEEMIRKYVDKPPEGAGEPMRKALAIPEGMSPQGFALWLRMNNPQINFELVDISERSEEDFPIERVGPPRKTANPCVWPTALERMSRRLLTAAIGLGDDAGEGDPPPNEEQARGDKDALAKAARALLGNEEEGEATSDEPRAPDRARETVKIYVDPERGVVIEGKLEVVEEVEESIDDLKKEMETLRSPPDIRIYRVKYIDVFTATEIINEMFNATRQQRQQVQQQQRRAQQQARQQQQQQRRQQQQQQQQQGKQGQPGQQQQRGQRGQQQQASIPQLPPTQVRVYPNPRDRTLILRADSSQYPALLELLSTIDQPQPIESKFRTYTLKKLNAVEVEEVLKDMLGLTAAQSRTRRTPPTRQGGRAGATRGGGRAGGQSGGQLPEAIMQTKADGTKGELGVDPKDIKISSNEETNTILVMAPEAALDYIGDLIEQLESQDVPDRVWKTYELKYADADGVVEYLDSYYGEEGSSSKKKGRGSRNTGSGLRSKALNAPTFIAYGRLNLLSAQATAEQFEEIDTLIEKVDVRSEEEEWQTVTLARADAGTVADTLTQMFGSGTQQRRGQRGKPSAPGGTGPKFIGEEGGRIVHFAAPNNLREDILAVIEQIEVETERKTKPRIIQLERATPSKVAEAIESAFSTQSAGPRGGGRRRSGASSGSRFTLTPHDGTKRLFVIADDATFAEIETLAKLLDVEPDMGVEFRIYPLRFADAKKIHEQMKELMADYVRMLGRDGGNLPPFSVNVDEKANSLIVLGNQAVFSFVEKNLAGVDIPANQRDLPDMLMVKLVNAKAQEVAQTINRLWSAKNLPAGEVPPVAEGNVALNTLIVRGTQSQIEEIRTQFIEPLEENAAPSLLTETFILKYAQPETVADLINLIYEDKAKAIKALGRESNVPPMEYSVAATPDMTTRQVIVQASEANMERIRKRIAELDTEENAAGGIVRVITLKFSDAT
ncbi:MAG: hypothetical protein IIB60_03670, partial [Planctomycetes bacterium]|nr:hypothetical protein [Planctomycetota bacterium]